MINSNLHNSNYADFLDAIIQDPKMATRLNQLSIADLLKELESDQFNTTAKLVITGLCMTELINEFLNNKNNNDEYSAQTKFRLDYNLSVDEVDTLKMLAEGQTNQQIADELGNITIEGIAKRVKQILIKLNVDNRIQASVIAAKEGLV